MSSTFIPGVSLPTKNPAFRSAERPGQWEAIEQNLESFPGKTPTLAATAQPLEPDPLRHCDPTGQAAKVTVHPKVVKVTDKTSRERCVLRL